jgi:signal peptidase II
MPKLYPKQLMLGLCITLVSMAVDLWSKKAALTYFMDAAAPTIEVTSFFNLALVYNRGISFGMLAQHNQPLYLVGLSVVVCTLLLAWMATTPFKTVAGSLGLIIGGAVGNCYDRLTIGAVVDFLDFHLLERHWPAFNIADSSIFIGVVLLCIHSMFIEPRKTQ